MLIEFRVENHRSLRDEQVFTMEAGRLGDPSDPRPRKLAGYSGSLLPAAALYGANASGKSNVLFALAFMRDAVIHSHRNWAPDGGVPRDPFRWGAKALDPSLFEVSFLISGVRYQYGFVVSDECFIEEWLYAWPKGRKQTWLQREGDSFKFGEQLQGENKLVEQVTRENALFLSAAVQHRHKQLGPLYWWFHSLRKVNIPERWRSGSENPMFDRWFWRFMESASVMDIQRSLFEDEPSAKGRFEAFRALLRAADIGIIDFKLVDERDDTGRRMRLRKKPSQIMVKHRSDSGDAWLPLTEESQGTVTLFSVGPMLLETLGRGGILVIDELEASLHPLLALQIVKWFNDPGTNPYNAQIIFTTHDTNLLGTTPSETPLRRDQIWLTEKDKDGATCLYPLTDYKPRKAENLERGYLQGRYGAIPYLGDFVHGYE